MNKTDIVNEIANNITNMLTTLVCSNAHRLYDDLRKMTTEEKKEAVIALKPELKIYMDTEGVIDINANMSWKYELKRSDRIEGVHIDPDQITMNFGDEDE